MEQGFRDSETLKDQAIREYLMALMVKDEDPKRGDIRLADWAIWWVPRLLMGENDLT